MIKITKALVSSNEYILLNSEWVGNSHWLIKKSAIAARYVKILSSISSAEAYYNKEIKDLPRKAVDNLLKSDTSVLYIKTEWIRNDAAFYEGNDLRSVAFVNNFYAKSLDLCMLFGAFSNSCCKSPLWNDSKDICIMPVNYPRPEWMK